MIVNIAGVWTDAASQHQDYVKGQMSLAIAKIVKTVPDTRVRSTVLAFTRYFIELILDPAETKFADAISCYEDKFPKGRPREQAKKLFKTMFDYDAFRDKNKLGKHWCAYDLCEKARFKVCPYCHLRSIGTRMPNAQTGDKGYRPELDHYYSKSDYPFLALSLGNLIPSCELCNGPKMKHDLNVGNTPMLHPLGHEESIRFALGERGDFENPLMWNLQGVDSAYRIEVMGHLNIQLASKSIQVFQLEGRYNEEPVIAGVLERLRELGREWDQSRQLFHFVAKTDYRNLENNGYRNRLQGRLLRDIQEQLCVPLALK